MSNILHSSAGHAVIWTAVLAVLLVCACYVVLKFRDRAVGDDSGTSDLLSNFRELHDRGQLDESEFRTIKTMLGGKLQRESKAKESEGLDRPSGSS